MKFSPCFPKNIPHFSLEQSAFGLGPRHPHHGGGRPLRNDHGNHGVRIIFFCASTGIALENGEAEGIWVDLSSTKE